MREQMAANASRGDYAGYAELRNRMLALDAEAAREDGLANSALMQHAGICRSLDQFRRVYRIARPVRVASSVMPKDPQFLERRRQVERNEDRAAEQEPSVAGLRQKLITIENITRDHA